MARNPQGDRRVFRPRRAVYGLLSGAFLLVGVGCDEPPLEPWHTEKLNAEFTADKADQVQSFDDYKELEDALFRQLDEEVYANVGTGPEMALARYSPGSAADPRGRRPDWNRSFELPANETVGAVLLLHGLTDAPYTLRSLGTALNARGYWVLGLRLPGHGTAPSGLATVTWRDMAAAVRLGMWHLASKVGKKPIHIIGYSTGAPLALNVALDAQEGSAAPVPAALVLISPAIGIHRAAGFAGMKTGLSALPGLGGLAWLQIVPEFDPYKYNSFATNAGAQVHDLTRTVATRVAARAQSRPAEILPPILVFKSTVDATVSTGAVVDRLLSHLAPDRHELVLFDINRVAVKSSLIISDPGPFTDRLMADASLPFAVTLITNEGSESNQVAALRKPPFSATAAQAEQINLAWPAGVISLSHIALPFSPEDPLYGQRPPGNEDTLFLGQMAIQGERDLLQFPADWLLRLRHNPFYEYLETRVFEWLDRAGGNTAHSGAQRDGQG